MMLDVRSAREFRAGHVPGARHVPWWRLLMGARPPAAADGDPIVVYCGHGPRAWMAGLALRLRGEPDVRMLRGHMRAWRKAGRPLERG